ncbi:MAG TPA: M24 family metallopeptidase [Chloroflexota bacterium]
MSENGVPRRREQIREIIEREGLGAIVLSRFPNFAWYTGGGDNRVDHSAPFGVADIVVTPTHECVVTSNIEAGRMRDEGPPGFEVVAYPWYEDNSLILADLSEGKPIGSDGTVQGSRDVTQQIAALRRVLDDGAVAQYREVGALAVAAMDEACSSLAPGMREWDAVARLEAACRHRGLYSPVAMAAGDDRIVEYRHPVVRGIRFTHRVMLVLCAERYGLYANLTRFVQFVEPDAELQQRFQACRTILARMREEATRPGRTLAEAFADCKRYYADAGYPEEWQLHHQGGMTGYATREIIATSRTAVDIQIGQAFAWNPSITGAKEEETFVLTPAGPGVLTGEYLSL